MQNINFADFFNWLSRSSIDPAKAALTVQGFFSLAVVQTLFNMLGVFGIHPTFTLALAGQDAYTFVYSALMIVSYAITAYGLLRKWMVYAHDFVPRPQTSSLGSQTPTSNNSASTGI